MDIAFYNYILEGITKTKKQIIETLRLFVKVKFKDDYKVRKLIKIKRNHN